MLRLTTFRALRHRNFRLFFFGQLTSLVGTWMHSLAQGWLVLQLTNSAFALGVIGTCGYLPTLLFSFWGGSVADHRNKRHIVLATQTVATCLAFTLGMLVVSGVIRIWHVGVVAFLMGTTMAFDLPARQSFLIELVGREDLGNAIGLNSSIFNAARLVGPGIAGFIIARFGVGVCFLLNSLSFVAVILGLLHMRELPGTRSCGLEKRGGIRDVLCYLGERRELAVVLVLVAAFSIFVFPYHVLLPMFARDILKVGPKGLGFLFAAQGLGALIGAIAVASVNVRSRLVYLFSNSVLFAGFVFFFSVCGTFAFACVFLFLAGMTMVGFMTTANAFLQTSVSDEKRGRIMGLYSIVFLGMMPVGSLISGSLAHYVGVPAAVAAGAIVAGFFAVALGVSCSFIMRGRVERAAVAGHRTL